MPLRIRKGIVFALSHVSVELIVFLVYLGYVFGNTFQSPAIYYRICRIYFGDGDHDCKRLLDPATEIAVQQRSAEWSLYNGLAYLTPALFADTILGAYGDKFGWKTPVVLGLCGVTIAEFGYMLTLSRLTNTPYWSTLFFGFVSGCSGSISIIPVACNAFLAEITEDSDLLTVRAALLSAFQTMASVLGGFAAAVLANSLRVTVAMDIELTLFFIALLFTLWRLPQRKKQQAVNSNGTPVITVQKPKDVSWQQQMVWFFEGIRDLLKAGIHTYSKPRVGRRRAFLLITCVVLVLSYTTSIQTTTSGVINSYVFRRTNPGDLDWKSDDLGYWNSSGYLMLAIGTLAGTWLLKRLGFRETTLMLIGVASSGARVLLIGMAENDAVMYISNAAGVFAGLVQPAGVSFIVQLVAPSEVGKAFSLMGVGGDLSYLIVSALYALVYRFSVAFDAGAVFFCMAALHAVAFVLMFWVHVQSIRDGVCRRRYSSNLTQAISRIGSPSLSTDQPPDAAANGHHNTLSMPKWMKKKTPKITIADHAEALEHNGTLRRGIWQSEEDIRESPRSINRTLY